MFQLSRTRWPGLAIAALVWLPTASATTVTFDESPAANGTGAYGETISGAVFSATNAGTWGGLSNGDPGNWDLEGTNGPQFLGFNGSGGSHSEVVTFQSAVTSVSLDFSRSLGSADGMITLQAFDGATLLGSTSAMLGPINSWTTLSLAFSSITSISWEGTGTGFHPYGVDNFTFNAVPEPGSACLLAGGLVCVVGLRRLIRR
jgi:hypothetical protein